MWGSLGDLTFELFLTPEEFRIREKENYATIDVYGQKPSLQHTKTELKRIPLKIKVFRTKEIEPKEFLQNVKALMQRKESQPLVIGDEYLGDFVIEELTTIYKRTDQYGNPLALILEINLLEVKENGTAGG